MKLYWVVVVGWKVVGSGYSPGSVLSSGCRVHTAGGGDTERK